MPDKKILVPQTQKPIPPKTNGEVKSNNLPIAHNPPPPPPPKKKD